MIPVITSFLPPVNPRSYIPAIFKLWQAFNSMVIDDRCLEFFGELAEEFVDSETEWKDVGIWTEEEWVFIAGKMLNSMSELHYRILLGLEAHGC
jgi:proteasome activator subunit 4